MLMTPLEKSQIETLIDQAHEKASLHFQEHEDHKIFELDEEKLLIRLDDVFYVTYKKLGSGAQGSVHLGVQVDIDKELPEITDAAVAIKISDVSEQGFGSSFDTKNNIQLANKSNSLLKELGLSKGFGVGKRTKNMYVEELGFEQDCNLTETISILPLHSGKDMSSHDHSFSYGSFSIASMASQTSKELALLHNKNVLHNDLKPANIMWDTNNDIVKIIDYDSATRLEENQIFVLTDISSDKDYMAPETDTNEGYRFSKASDIYSLGKSFNSKLRLDKMHLSYPELLIKQQIEKMMAKDPTKRPTIEECINSFDRMASVGQKLITEKDNTFIQALGKNMVSLEIYINHQKFQGKIKQTLGQRIALSADQQKKLETANEALETIVKHAAADPIDYEAFKTDVADLIKKEEQAQGLLSSRGELRKILDTLDVSIENAQAYEIDPLAQPKI